MTDPIPPLDLGCGHTLELIGFTPDRSIRANAETFANIPDDPRTGAIVNHPRPDGTLCLGGGYIRFDTPVSRQLDAKGPFWTVESWNPLTLSPSLQCTVCGDHGFIRGGKWVRA